MLPLPFFLTVNSLIATYWIFCRTIQLKSKPLPMNTEKLQEVIHWLNQQIHHLNESIQEAHRTNNLGRETQCEGMRDAFIRCLNKINS